MRYHLLREAQLDLRSAATYYEENSGGARSRQFLAEFRHSMELLVDYPELGSPWLDGTRRQPMRRFPYGVIYRIIDDSILVVAVAHNRQRPSFWLGRE